MYQNNFVTTLYEMFNNLLLAEFLTGYRITIVYWNKIQLQQIREIKNIWIK